jgi:acylphosphatase
MLAHKKITVIGRVQGVGFRYTARSVAQQLNIKGFVKNMPNNEVYIEAEGESDRLDDFIKWCHQGPPHARIDHVIVYDGIINQYNEFVVAR